MTKYAITNLMAMICTNLLDFSPKIIPFNPLLWMSRLMQASTLAQPISVRVFEIGCTSNQCDEEKFSTDRISVIRAFNSLLSDETSGG